MALNLTPFGRWTLRDNAAQRRLPMKTFSRLITLLALVLISTCGLAQQKSTFVFVKITEAIMPLDRGSKYEDPLDNALKKAKLDEVAGGGSSLSKERKIEWVGVDVELTDIDKGIRPFPQSGTRSQGKK